MPYTLVDLTMDQKLVAINSSNAAERINSIFSSLIINTNATFEEVSTAVNNINAILNSDDTALDELQEVVNFIKANRSDLENLGISNIAGLQASLNSKQATLVSGTNIKTINGSSILGSGDLTVSATWGLMGGDLSNQTDLQNALNSKQDVLISGSNIKSIGGVVLLVQET